jgi:hypothetical protein
VQGYLLARPMEPDDLTRWLTEEPRALPPAPAAAPAIEAESEDLGDPGDTPSDVPESEKS